MAEPFRLHLSRQAARALQQLDTPTRSRFARALDRLRQDPFDPTLDIRPLKGRPGLWRLRVGERRLLYSVDLVDRIVRVYVISPRGDVYKR